MKHIRKCILDIALCVVFLGSIWIPSIAVENKQITSESSVLVPTYRAIPSPAADSSWTTLYAETFATDTGWDLVPSSGDEWISIFAPVTEIAYVRSNYPTTNYGSDIYIYEEYFNFESQSCL